MTSISVYWQQLLPISYYKIQIVTLLLLVAAGTNLGILILKLMHFNFL